MHAVNKTNIKHEFVGYWPFLEVDEDLSEATSSTNHGQVNGSQETKVDSDNILANILNNKIDVL